MTEEEKQQRLELIAERGKIALQRGLLQTAQSWRETYRNLLRRKACDVVLAKRGENKMPLNLTVGDAEFVPFLKYNAKAGRFYVRPDGAQEEVEISNPVLAFDMAHVKTGWLYYAEGSGPEKVWDPSPTQMAPKPPGPRKFKRGFEVMVFGNAMIPRTTQKIGLRELSSTAANVITAMLRMHADYEAGLKTNTGNVPIFACEGVRPINGTYGVNYEPQFVLKGWVPRSRVPAFDEFQSHAVAQSAATDFGSEQQQSPSQSENSAPFSDNIPF